MSGSRDAQRRIEHYVPGIKTALSYRRAWLRSDLVAGLTVFAILVPQGMAYGELAGVEPVVGLYTALAAMVAYALFGTSRQLMVGPESGIAILVAASVAPLAGGDSSRFAALAAVLALMVGAICIVAGLLKAGFLADFLSMPILVGYTNGAALIIIGSQLGKLFGVEIESKGFFAQIWEVLGRLDQTHWLTLGIGLALVAFLVAVRRLAPWLPGAVVIVVAATAVAALLNLEVRGVAVVGEISAGLPTPAVPDFSVADVRALLPAAISLALVAFSDSVLTARLFAAKNGYEIDANQELVALGAAQVASGIAQGFPGGSSQSRTLVDDDAGGRTQFAGVVAAVSVVVFLLLFTPLLQSLPTVALAAILVVAAVGLISIGPVQRMYSVRPVECFVAVLTTLLVLILGILPGILAAVALSLLDVIRRISRPNDAVLGSIEGVDGFHAVDPHVADEAIPGLIVYRFDAPLFFANSEYFLGRARELISAAKNPVRCFLINAEGIFYVDTTAAQKLDTLRGELEGKGAILAIARANRSLRETLKRAGLIGKIGHENIFPSVRTGVKVFLERDSEYGGQRP